MKITAVKDMKSQMYLTPQANPSLAIALRNWEIVSNDSDSMISRFPHDFRLIHVGDFNTETGEIITTNQDLGSAADFKKSPPQNPLPFPQVATAQ